ncbi:hypothetical protein [Rhizobium sp. R693]|uniref:hypothetical protein n=1 Tax=Rhizobium sp. R693 TaxID=1764276 RepID=UPI000B738DAE|nr:hypothetical protein [Rhizobium sp. R693]OWV84538.1 hypothetical protein ATY79_11500 [Rhizobium sp. R693]
MDAVLSSDVQAAAFDGAAWFKILWRIEPPLMLPILAITFFIRFIEGFRVFDNVYALTRSGGGGSTTSLSISICQALCKGGAWQGCCHPTVRRVS